MADTDTNRQEFSSPDDSAPRISDSSTLDVSQKEKEKEKQEVTIDSKDDKDNEDDEHNNEIKDGNEKPLLDDDSIKIDITSKIDEDDLSHKKKNSLHDSELERAKLPDSLSPFIRIKVAWDESTHVFQFMGTALCIIFQTVGWFTCIGGIPFLSLVMLVIGSLYVNECSIEPNIPVYLIVSGVMGTIQHGLTVWMKYVPKQSQGRIKVDCQYLHGILHLFLMIWFILGCFWVYGVYSDVEFGDRSKREYCHRTLYLFSFWTFNLSFILLGLLFFLSICFLVCIIAK